MFIYSKINTDHGIHNTDNVRVSILLLSHRIMFSIFTDHNNCFNMIKGQYISFCVDSAIHGGIRYNTADNINQYSFY